MSKLAPSPVGNQRTKRMPFSPIFWMFCLISARLLKGFPSSTLIKGATKGVPSENSKKRESVGLIE